MCLGKFDSRADDEGSLIITFLRADRTSIARIASWEKGFGLEMVKGGENDFSVIDSQVALFNTSFAKKPDHSTDEFISRIPKNVLAIAQKSLQFQYQTLWVLYHSHRALDLYKVNRNLFYQLIQSRVSRAGIIEALKRPQHDILQVLYPENRSSLSYRSVARLLGKKIFIHDENEAIFGIRRFLDLLFSGKLKCRNEKMLLHLKYIPDTALSEENIEYLFRFHPGVYFNNAAGWIDNAFERGIEDDPDIINVVRIVARQVFILARDYVDMARTQNMTLSEIDSKLSQLASLDELEALHQEMMVMCGHADPNDEEVGIPDIQHIEPPVPGTDCIIPLRSYDAFVEEGRRQRHCLANADYIRYVARGESYLYTVVTPDERCTLELGIGDEGWCWIKQLNGKYNREPGKPTCDLVENWLRTYLKTVGIEVDEFGYWRKERECLDLYGWKIPEAF